MKTGSKGLKLKSSTIEYLQLRNIKNRTVAAYLEEWESGDGVW
jgi:hypothetical protein